MLTIGTDNPAFPPWFGGDPPQGSTWQTSDPTSGKGYESATAYAIAQQLGFAKDKVAWVAGARSTTRSSPARRTSTSSSTRSRTAPERAQAVDLSDGYFDDSQAVVTDGDNAIGTATSVADLKKYQLGVAVGTTSLTYITDEHQARQGAARLQRQRRRGRGAQGEAGRRASSWTSRRPST